MIVRFISVLVWAWEFMCNDYFIIENNSITTIKKYFAAWCWHKVNLARRCFFHPLLSTTRFPPFIDTNNKLIFLYAKGEAMMIVFTYIRINIKLVKWSQWVGRNQSKYNESITNFLPKSHKLLSDVSNLKDKPPRQREDAAVHNGDIVARLYLALSEMCFETWRDVSWIGEVWHLDSGTDTTNKLETFLEHFLSLNFSAYTYVWCEHPHFKEKTMRVSTFFHSIL